MNVMDSTELRMEIDWSLSTYTNYIEWAQYFEKILNRLPPNSQICEIIMDFSISSKYHRDYFIDFASWLCSNNEEYCKLYEQIFKDAYKATISQAETDHHRIYEQTKFFAILLWRDSISWNILSCITLRESSSSFKEYFATLLLIELCKQLGSENLSDRLMQLNLQKKLDGLFPKDKLENILYAIGIFELVNLQTLAHHLQEYVNKFQNDDELALGIEQMNI